MVRNAIRGSRILMSRGRIVGKFFKRITAAILGVFLVSSAFSADRQDVAVLYPKDNSIVGRRVNLVLDPTDIPYFQIIVNKTEYPVVDTSRGSHAYQGLELAPGQNVITVNVLAQTDSKEKISVVASRSLKVFNRDGFFSLIPAEFTQDPFHTRERESTCGSCHRLEVTPQDAQYAKPEDVLCYSCHREITKGRHVHGPAAVWNCLSCHNPEIYPAKYAFSSLDPWKVAKTTQSVEPRTFTISSSELFKSGSAVLISKGKAKEAFGDVLNHMRQNPADKMRLEVHTDNTRLKLRKTKKGKLIGFKNNFSLSVARAKTLASLLKESGVAQKKLIAVGMGEKLPKAPNKTMEGRELNNRVEVVVYPSDVKVINSRKLPVLKDRERVVVSVAYSRGPQIKKLRIRERLPKGMQYSKGSGFYKGRAIEPKPGGNELIWELGDMDSNFAETLFYVVKKRKVSSAVPDETRVTYVIFGREQTREFDPRVPAKQAHTIMETCLKCHDGIVSKKFKHGPVDGGYCTLCHDPHASENSAWLRKPVWDLCTTCHTDQGSGVHVVAGFVKGKSHPTRKKRDYARPGKRLSCSSCHEPHSAASPYLFAYDAKTGYDLCIMCHKTKFGK